MSQIYPQKRRLLTTYPIHIILKLHLKKDMKKKGFIGLKKKPISEDLTYLKGTLGE